MSKYEVIIYWSEEDQTLWAAGKTVESEDRRQNPKESRGDPLLGGLPRIRADAGLRIPGQEARHHGEPENDPELDEGIGSVERQAAADRRGASMATAAESVWGTGVMGHQRA